MNSVELPLGESDREPDFTLNHKRALLVEDDPMLRGAVSDLLRSHGCYVSAVSTGEEALRITQEQIPDFVLLDVVMHGMDGFEVFAELRADPRFAELPIIFLTGLADERLLKEANRHPLDRVRMVSKPFKIEDLLQALGELF